MKWFTLTLKIFFLTIICYINPCVASLPSQTPLAEHHYQHLPSSQEITLFLKKLEANNPYSKLVYLGKSAGNRDIHAMLFSKDPDFLKNNTPNNKLTVLLMGSIHGTEPSGSESLQQLALNLSKGDLNTLSDNMNLILVVNANPDGRDKNSRYNAQRKNLNIDFAQQSQPETQIFANLLNKYRPHAILDLHESSIKKPVLTLEQGYMTEIETQYEMSNNPNIAPQILEYQKILLKNLIDLTQANGLRSTHYKGEIQTLNQPVAHGGLHIWNLRNYSGLMGSFSFLVENRRDPREGSYSTPGNIQQRVEKQYLSALTFLTLMQKNQLSILNKVNAVKEAWLKENTSQPELKLQAKYNLDPQNPLVAIPLKSIKTQQIEMKEFANNSFVEIQNTTPLPLAYVVTSNHQEIAELLHKHKIAFEILQKSRTVTAMPLQITAQKINPSNNKSRRSTTIEADYKITQQLLQKGDIIISTKQPNGRLVAILLDPRSMDSIYQEESFKHILANNTLPTTFPIA